MPNIQQTRRWLLTRPAVVVSGTPLSLDGSAHNVGSGTTLTVTLSTTLTNDIIVIDIISNGSFPTGVSGATIGAFTARETSTPGLNRWYAVAASALSSEVLTITNNSATGFQAATAYGINGANTSSPFDSGSSTIDSTAPADPVSFNTTAADTMIIGAFRMATQASPTAGSGFTTISANADFMLAEYKIVSSAQTGLSVPITTGSGDSSASIVDALVKA